VTRRRDERGTALVEVTWLTVLLLVPLVYVLLAVFAVQRSAFAVSAATRAAGRAYATAPSEDAGRRAATTAAEVALRDQGLDLGRASVRLSCTPEPGNCLAPGAVIHVDVGYPVPLPLVPAALGGNTPSIRVESTHAVPYGDLREDLP
jgi:Flp pilus assembly protein TadG